MSCAWASVRGLGLNERDITRIQENDLADISSGNAKPCLTTAAIRCYIGPRTLKTLTSEEQPVRHFSSVPAEPGPLLIQRKPTRLSFSVANDLTDK